MSSFLMCLRPVATVNKVQINTGGWKNQPKTLQLFISCPHTCYGSLSIVTDTILPPSERKQWGHKRRFRIKGCFVSGKVMIKNTSHVSHNDNKWKCEKKHQQHTSFLFAVVHCVLYFVAKHTRVGLPISRAVI